MEKKRVTSLGGIFFKCQDPDGIKKWYQDHLGLNVDQYGTSFEWRKLNTDESGFTAWSPFSDSTTYFEPSKKEFMINYRVENLDWLIPILREEGVVVIGEIQTFEYGKFAHILDMEGNKIELWEPDDKYYAEMVKGKTTK